MKSNRAAARDKWMASKEGQEAAFGQTEGRYLRNRLEAAFLAGYEAGLVDAVRGISGHLMAHAFQHADEAE